jgi:hypothetical protein
MSTSRLAPAILYAATAALWSVEALKGSFVGLLCTVVLSFLAGASAVASRYEVSE